MNAPNPFALPPETDGRFRLLILTSILLVWSLASQILATPSLIDAAVGIGPAFRRLVAGAVENVQAGNPPRMPSREDIEALRAELPAMKKVARLWKEKFLLTLGLSSLFVAVAVAFYKIFPRFLRRFYDIHPLSPEDAPRTVAAMHHAARLAGLRQPPELCRKSGMLDGLSFVQSGRPFLAIAGHPRQLDGLFSLTRVVALHELAHVVNGDGRKREIARAFWVALGLVLVLAFVLFMHHRQPDALELAVFAGRTAGVVLIAWMLWGGLVRAREFYADWRVVTWGLGPALLKILSLPSGRAEGGNPLLRRLAPWSMHPDKNERTRMVKDGSGLFRASPTIALLTGALLGLFTGNAGSLAEDILVFLGGLGGGLAGLARNPVILLPFAFSQFFLWPFLLVMLGRWLNDALGVQVLRSSLYSLHEGPPEAWGYVRSGILAVALAIGFEAGLALTPAAFFGWQGGVYMVYWWFGFVLLVAFWAFQTRAFGRLILGAAATGETAKRLGAILRWLATIQLAAIFLPAIAWRFAAHVRFSPETWVFLQDKGASMTHSLPIFVSSTWVFTALFLLFSALWGGGIFLCALFWLTFRRVSCAACGNEAPTFSRAGDTCPTCNRELAAWLYSQPFDEKNNIFEVHPR